MITAPLSEKVAPRSRPSASHATSGAWSTSAAGELRERIRELARQLLWPDARVADDGEGHLLPDAAGKSDGLGVRLDHVMGVAHARRTAVVHEALALPGEASGRL